MSSDSYYEAPEEQEYSDLIS